MGFSKSVIVIKQVTEGYSASGKTISGIARIERENDECDFYLSVINLLAVEGGTYCLLLCGNNGFCYYEDLGARPLSLVRQIYPNADLKNGFAVAIAFVKDNLPQVVAFSRTDECPVRLADARKLVAERFYSLVKKDILKAINIKKTEC